MKGIILAGGSGTRLYPITKAVSKQLLPIYDKPMIYYPLSVLMLSKIRDILIVSNPEFLEFYQRLLGNGEQLGLNISYKAQERPNGLPDAFLVGKEFIGKDPVCLILGDNVFFGQGFGPILNQASELKDGGLIFGYYVKNPEEFGVVEFDKNNNVLSIEEKPKKSKSNYAIPGLYFFDNDVIKITEILKPSARGELEITDIIKKYLEKKKLKVRLLGRGFAWLDTGTYEGLLEASNFIGTIQKRQGLYVACIEEIAFRMRFIDKTQLLKLASGLHKTEYGKYLEKLAHEVD